MLGEFAAREHDRAAALPARGRGAPADDARDKLVSVVFAVYPPDAAKRTRGSRFEKTVEMVLGFCLGRDVEDVHRLVREALRRQLAANLVFTDD